MTSLTNSSKQAVTVEDGGEQKEIAPGATVDVDGRQNWRDHLFVKAGWLEVVEPVKPEPKPEPVVNLEPEVAAPDPEPAKASKTKRRNKR